MQIANCFGESGFSCLQMKCLGMKSGLFTYLRCHFGLCFRNCCSIPETSPVWQQVLEYKSVYQNQKGFRREQYRALCFPAFIQKGGNLFVWGLKGFDVKLEGEQKLDCYKTWVQSWFNSSENHELWSALVTITAKNCSCQHWGLIFLIKVEITWYH